MIPPRFFPPARRLAGRLFALVPGLAVAAAAASASAQTAVQVGNGSYASFVPTGVAQDDSYYALPADQVTSGNTASNNNSGNFFNLLHLDPSLQGKAIPTNHWWTDLLVGNRSGQQSVPAGSPAGTLPPPEYILKQDPYGTNIVVSPYRLDPKSYGFDLYYPTAWKAQNTGGNQPNTTDALDMGTALSVRGDRGYTVPNGDLVVADFENGYPSGTTFTTVSGTNPFAAGPATSSWKGTAKGYLGNAYASSQCASATASPSNSNQGIVTFPSFTISKHYVHLLVGGCNDSTNAVARLHVGGQVVATATGTNSTTMNWNSWDVSSYNGQSAYIDLVDTTTAAYGYIFCDEIVQSDASNPSLRYGTDYAASNSSVTNWGDWNVDFNLVDANNNGQNVAVTMARGIPFTWSTWTGGVKPKLMVGAGMTFQDASGNNISTSSGSFVASSFSFVYTGKTYGVFLPDNTTVTVGSNFIEPQLSGNNNYLVVGFLPAASNLTEFANAAYAKPTDTKLAWSYNPAAGAVSTTWTVSTTALKSGASTSTIQGFLPHHYRVTTGLPTLSSYTYLTARGTMKCATGTSWTINFPFNGLVPMVPAPVATSDANPYQPARMQSYLSGYTPQGLLVNTYNAGKSLELCAQHMAFAYQSGDTSDGDRLKNLLEGALSNWFVYTPGEENNAAGTYGFFASYPDWHALIGFDCSYGSQAFNDLHFHYGYFANTSAILAMYDPAFVNKYSDMLRLIVKSYGNYDRNDNSSPFLRMFDVWEGHSNAGGLSGSGGENQESSSEAMQSWAGMYLLGGMLNDSQMTAAGAMGFAIESLATNEYWENLWGNDFDPNYQRAWASQVWSDHSAYANYFTAEPAWQYAIQMCPSNHWLNYLTRYQPTTLTNDYNAIWSERDSWATTYPTWTSGTAYAAYAFVTYNKVVYEASQNGVSNTTTSPDQDKTDWGVIGDCTKDEPGVLGGDLEAYILFYQALLDPDSAAKEYDNYVAANDSSTPGVGSGSAAYYFLHATRQLGPQDFTRYTSSPLSMVYKSKSGQYTYLVQNPTNTEQTVSIYQTGTSGTLGQFRVPANKFIATHNDAALDHVVLTASNNAAVIPPGQTVQYTLTGYDQYGATYPLTGTTWSTAGGGGTINSSGLFTASTNAYPVTVTGANSGKSATSPQFRVGAASVLTTVSTTPGFTRVINGNTQQYNAVGYDQYGNTLTLGSVTWATTGGVGSIDNTGLFTASTLGTGYVKATSGGVTGGNVVVVHDVLANVAQGKPVTASSVNGSVTGTYKASNIVDGNTTTTRWESASADNQYIYVDLGKVYDLNNVVITWYNGYAKTFEIDVATTVDSNNNPVWSPAVQNLTKTDKSTSNIPLTGNTGRYVKLNLFTRGNNYGFAIWEVQIYGFINGASVTTASVKLNPDGASVASGNTLQYIPYAFDTTYDGGPVTASSATWSVSGGGTINANGLFSATTVGGPFTVTGTVGGVAGTTNVTVTSAQAADTNLAAGKTCTASSVNPNQPGNVANNATDASTTTRWESVQGSTADPSWIYVDLGQTYTLSTVKILWQNAGGKDYLVQTTSADPTVEANWTNAAPEITNGTAGENRTVALNGGTTGRYVRVYGKLRTGIYGYSILDLQVLGH